MDKLLLLSVIIVTIAIPGYFARDRNPNRGLWRAIVALCIFIVFYFVVILLVAPGMLL